MRVDDSSRIEEVNRLNERLAVKQQLKELRKIQRSHSKMQEQLESKLLTQRDQLTKEFQVRYIFLLTHPQPGPLQSIRKNTSRSRLTHNQNDKWRKGTLVQRTSTSDQKSPKTTSSRRKNKKERSSRSTKTTV